MRPPARGLAEPVGARPQQAVARHGVDEALDVDLARAGHQAHADLPGAAPLADDEVAQQPRVRPAVEGVEALRPRPGEHGLARLVAALGGEQAVGDADDLLPRARRVEAADELAGRVGPEGVLELVAVAPLLDGGDDVVEHVALEMADALERVVDLRVLDLDLALVREDLPRGARMVGDLGDPVGRGLEHLGRARLGVRALALRDDGADAVAGDAAAHEDDVAVQPCDAVAAVGEVVDAEVQLGAALGARRGGGRRGHGSEARSHSSSAFWACRRFSAWSQIRWRSP